MNDISGIRNYIKDIIYKNNIEELKNYVQLHHLELKKLNNKDFDILEYTYSLLKLKKVSKELKSFVINNYDHQRNNVIEIVKSNSIDKLKKYLKDNNLYIKDVNYKNLDIIKLFIKLSDKKKISNDILDYIITHYDKTKGEIVDIIRSDDINKLMEYIKENDIELQNLNNNHFDVIKYCSKSYNKISGRMKNFVISHINKIRYKVVELLRNDDISELKLFIDENNINLKSLNDDNFNLVKYCSFPSNHISLKAQDFIASYFTDVRSQIIQFIKENDTRSLLDFMHKNNIELCDLNNDQFDICDYCYSKENKISSKMKNFISLNFTKERYEVIKLIRNGDIQKLRIYLTKNTKELKEFNDKYFDIINFCKHDKHTEKNMVRFVVNHLTKERGKLVDLISDNDIDALKEFIQENDIELKSLNDDNFDLIDFCFSNENNISSEMQEFVITHYDKVKYSIIEMISMNMIDELKKYVKSENFEFKSLNTDRFDIKDYCYNNRSRISPEIQNFINNNYDKMHFIIDILHENNLEKLKQYEEECNFEFKILNNDNFNIIDYVCSLYEETKISKEIKDFVLSYYDKNIAKIIKLMIDDDRTHLKRFLKNNEISLNYSSNVYLKIMKNNHRCQEEVSSDILNLVICHFDKKRNEFISIIKKDDLSELRAYHKENKIELKEFIDDTFNIIEYCKAPENNISERITNYIISHIDKKRSTVVDLIKSNNIDNLKKYMEENDLEFKELNDEYFNIIQFCRNSFYIYPTMVSFIKSHFDKKRYRVVELIMDKRINELKEFFIENEIDMEELNDENFDIIDFCCEPSNHVIPDIKDFVLCYSNKERFGVINLIRSNNISELENFLKTNNIELSKLNDSNHFDLIKYCDDNSNNISIPMKKFVINHFYKNRGDIVDILKENDLDKLKIYMKDNSININVLNDNNFNILKFLNTLNDNEKNYSEIKLYVLQHVNENIKDLFDEIKKNDHENLLKYLKNKESEYIINTDEDYYNIIKCSLNHLNNVSKNIVLNYFDPRKNKVLRMIRKGDLYELKEYLDNNLKEFKKLNSDYFDIQEYCCAEDNHLSPEIINFILSHYSKERTDIINIIKSNNIIKIRNYMEKNNYEFEDLNDQYFDIIKYINSPYNRINERTVTFIITHFNKIRSEVLEYIRKKDISELINYLNNNNIELKSLNDDYFDIRKYCNDGHNRISYGMKSYIWSHFDNQRSKIVEYIRNNKFSELNDYVVNQDIEFKNLNDDYFNIIMYCNRPENHIRNVALFTNYVIEHYDGKRKQFIEILKENDVNLLNDYIQQYGMELEKLNDSYFSIANYTYMLFTQHKISKDVKNFIMIYSNERRRNLIQNILNKTSINSLKFYIEENKIEFKNYNDNHFEIIDYIYSLSDNVIDSIKKSLILSNFDKEINKLVMVIKRNEMNEVKNYLDNNEEKFKEPNEGYYNVLKYFLSDAKTISIDIEKYILSYLNPKKIAVINMIKNNDLKKLEEYFKCNLSEFKILNDEFFDIQDYCCNSHHQVSNDIKYFILSHFNSQRITVINLIKKNNILNLKKYMEENNIEFKSLNDAYFDIIDFCNNNTNNIGIRMKNFILTNFSKARGEILKLIKNKDINALRNFIASNDIELCQLSDKHFDIREYCTKSENYITPNMKAYILSHYDNIRSDVVELLRYNKYIELKALVDEKNIEFKDLNDDYFDIIKYYMETSRNPHQEIIEFMIINYSMERKYIIKLINLEEKNLLEIYVKKHNFYFNTMNDKYFNIYSYVNSKNSPRKIKYLISDYYDKERNDIKDIIKSKDIEKFKDYISLKNIKFSKLCDKYFDIMSFAIKYDASMEIIKTIAKQYDYKYPVNNNEELNCSPIYWALFMNNYIAAELLIKRGKIDINVFGDKLLSKLKDNYSFTESNINYILQNNFKIETIQNFLRKNNHLHLKELINNNNFEILNSCYYNPLFENKFILDMLNCYKNKTSLYNSSIDRNRKKYLCWNENSLLDIFIDENDPEIILLFMNNIDVSSLINIKNADGLTPLTKVIKSNNYSENSKLEIISRFIEYGVDLNKRSNNEFSPLYLAIDRKLYSIIILLIQNGANINEFVGLENESLLMKAIDINNMNIDIIKYLIQECSNLNHVNLMGQSFIDKVISKNNIEIFEYLASHNINDFMGNHICRIIREDKLNLFKILIDNGFDGKKRDEYGQTPLDYAIQFKNKGFQVYIENEILKIEECSIW